MNQEADYGVRFTGREITAWGGLALMRRMLQGMKLSEAAKRWDLPQPCSNRGYEPLQIIEQFLVSIWCGANRFAHADITRMDSTLSRLFGWTRVAGHKAIMRLFNRFDMARNEQVQGKIYRWLFERLSIDRLTLDVACTVITRNGHQQGAAQGDNPSKKGRCSHHPLLAFIAETRMVANFWLRPGNTSSSNNILEFLSATLRHLGCKKVGLLRADSGFFDEAVMNFLHDRQIAFIISARLTQPLQQAMVSQCQFWAIAPGLEMGEISYQASNWKGPRRIVVVRQSVKVRAQAPGKTLKLFADDPDIQGWRYGAMVTSLELPALQVWRLYRGRADCENRTQGAQSGLWLGQLQHGAVLGHRGGAGDGDVGLQLDESVSSGGDALRGAPHAGDAAPQGVCHRRVLGSGPREPCAAIGRGTQATKVVRGTLESSRNRPRTASIRPRLKCRNL